MIQGSELTLGVLFPGAVKLTSDCPEESLVARYLLVKSILACIFWIIIAVLGYKNRLNVALENPFVEGCLILDATFSFGWFIAGNLNQVLHLVGVSLA